MTERPTLHLLCGKAAAGKSTLAAQLAADGSLLIAQDQWMAALFEPELIEVADYLRLAKRLAAAMDPQLVDLLRAGLSIVLDWPANTVASRAWLADVARRGGAEARLHWVEVGDAVCLGRLAARNASGTHEFRTSPEQFAELTRLFEPPTATEGLTIERR